MKLKRYKIIFQERGKRYREIVKIDRKNKQAKIYIQTLKGRNKMVVFHDFRKRATIVKLPGKGLCFIHRMDAETVKPYPKKGKVAPIRKLYKVLLRIKDLSNYSRKAQDFCNGMKIFLVRKVLGSRVAGRRSKAKQDMDDPANRMSRCNKVIHSKHYGPAKCASRICFSVPIYQTYLPYGC